MNFPRPAGRSSGSPKISATTKSGAWKAYDRALTATLQEPADELRRLELERIDTLFGAMYEGLPSMGTAGLEPATSRV